MRSSPMSPGRLLTVVLLTVALAVTMVAAYTISPSVPKASASGVITAAKAQEAVKWARSRAGDPYRAGGTGPHAFDCSGLTRWAFARVGRALPHSSAAQVAKTHRISKANRRPGDLVFYGNPSTKIHHVGLYIGNGQMINAATFGTPVQVAPVRWSGDSYAGTGRPAG